MYQITIIKIEQVKEIRRQYQKIADSGNEHDKGAIYGYVNMTDENVKKETKILEQTVEQLDLAAVIKAVNKI
jgi:cell fate (sporulation/competence/biofilm development) regulator YlbF (YheA/YmcA/DUF963 family)